MNEGGITDGVVQTLLGSVERGSGNLRCLGAGPNQADRLLPFPRSGEPAEPGVIHATSPGRRSLYQCLFLSDEGYRPQQCQAILSQHSIFILRAPK